MEAKNFFLKNDRRKGGERFFSVGRKSCESHRGISWQKTFVCLLVGRGNEKLLLLGDPFLGNGGKKKIFQFRIVLGEGFTAKRTFVKFFNIAPVEQLMTFRTLNTFFGKGKTIRIQRKEGVFHLFFVRFSVHKCSLSV